jgi:methylaspartate mutase epsilon subunit
LLREITEEFRDTPLQVRHSTRDPRLLAEISFAGGVSAFEGGAISYNMPYYRDYSPATAVRTWRYVDALTGRYHREFGLVIDREFFGVLTACLVPPCVAIAVTVLEALLAAREGVRSVSLGYAEQGYRPQDVAAIRALRRLARRYLDDHNHADVSVYTVFHQYMGAFPADPVKSRDLLYGSAVTAALSGATRVMTKTQAEAVYIPSAADNAESIGLVRQVLDGGAGAEDDVDRAAVDLEEDTILAEAGAIIDGSIRAGHGDVGRAVVAGVELGYLDIPFSPSIWNAGQVLSIRDGSGAVRLADPGRLPLPPDVLDHHRALVAARTRTDHRPAEEIIEEDILQIARGDFESWPLRDWATSGRGLATHRKKIP